MNHLAGQTSPYLLQHVRNPVDWHPWGAVALERSKREDKPIFLSIGYAACHWCHVMEHESFEDPKVAAYLNEHFVCIKVDREERPDLDEIYMAAVQGMTGHGGWPMSVWLTPDQKPFYAGTYFPPTEGRGLPSFLRVSRHVAELWRDRRDLVIDNAEKVTEYLRGNLAPELAPGEPSVKLLQTFLEQSAGHFDDKHPGFAQAPQFAPKFPHAAELQLLVRMSVGPDGERARTMAYRTLHAMADGGIHDQLGGGFHRYAVDRAWLVPHFEKMLYDNALLAPVYAEAFGQSGDQRFAEVTRWTLDYLVREMQDPAGGFWSSTDADSEGEEGRYFVWTKAEIDRVLGEDAALFGRAHDVRESGNWEGHVILRRVASQADLAREAGLGEDVVAARFAAARSKLLAVRRTRVPPGTDDKVLVAWNGMAIAALAEGYCLLGEERWLVAARRAANFVLAELRTEDGALLRTWRDGKAQLAGYLEDYAYFAHALASLYQADFDPRWLREAKALVTQMDARFGDEASGSFFFTAHDHEALLTRSVSVTESSTPSGVATAVQALFDVGALLGEDELWQRGGRALRAHHGILDEFPVAAPGLALAAHRWLSDPREVVIVAEDVQSAAAMLAAARNATPRIHAIHLVTPKNGQELAALSKVVADKPMKDGKPTAYVCRRGSCEAPTTSAGELAHALAVTR
ncbi:MAG: thioredoxin domain-containing protein [Planctomycetota bacterium]